MTAFLTLYDCDGLKKIFFSTTPPSDCTTGYRTSPIFPVFDPPVIPDFSTHSNISFIYCEHAFTHLGRLMNELAPEHHGKLWYSHGLASIIVLAEDGSVEEEIKSLLGEAIRACESWEVSENVVKVLGAKVLRSEIDPSKYTIRDYSCLSIDLQNVLSEFIHCIHSAVVKSATYMPKQLDIFERLVKAVDEIVDGLIFLENGAEGTHPLFVPETLSNDLKSNVSRKKRFHFYASQLVQINSAISYLISQGFSGTVPIFESECHVRSYSLLGIGTAYSALSCFARHVERVFQEHPVASAIEQEVYQQHPAPTLPTTLRNYPPAEWQTATHGIDKFLGGAPRDGDNPKMVYYSGRQGFRETKFSVSAPINILFSAGTARWSMMTLSHELLHAHVAAVIASALTSNELDQETLFQHIVDDYNLYKDGRLTRPLTLIDFLRFALISYSSFAEQTNEMIRKVKKGEADPTGSTLTFTNKTIRKVVEKHFSDVNEIMVHVLDYTYFYDNNSEVYLGLLWESWTPVPIVLEKVERYLLRSLLAVGTKELGTPDNRYTASVKVLHQVLNKILQTDAGNIVVEQALKFLDQSPVASPLFYKFTAGIFLADVTAKFIASSNIHAELMDDDLRDIGEGQQYVYNLKPGSIEEVHVKSPVALCDDLLRQALAKDVDYLETEAASAWAFLACASYNL